MVARGMLPVLFRRNLLRTEVDDAEAVARESPLADVVIYLGVEILVVGMVGVMAMQFFSMERPPSKPAVIQRSG